MTNKQHDSLRHTIANPGSVGLDKFVHLDDISGTFTHFSDFIQLYPSVKVVEILGYPVAGVSVRVNIDGKENTMKKPARVLVCLGLLIIAAPILFAQDSSMDSTLDSCPVRLETLMCISHIDEDLTLDGQVMNCPDGVRVDARLTLVGGSRIESGDIEVVNSGSIDALGTERCPIVLTSAFERPKPGDWQFHIHPSEDILTSLIWTVIEYAGEPDREAIETTSSDGTIAFEHVEIRSTIGRTALDLRDGYVAQFTDVHFSEIEGVAMEISPDESGNIGPAISMDADSVDAPWIHIRGNRLRNNVQWTELGVPYLLEDISVSGTLSIEEGTQVLMGDGADLRIVDGGRLIVSGTSARPVKFDGVSEVPQPVIGTE